MSDDIDFKKLHSAGRDRAHRIADGGSHPDEAQDKKLIKHMVGKAKIKLARGGVAGDKASKRLDKPVRSSGACSDRTPFKMGGKTKKFDDGGTVGSFTSQKTDLNGNPMGPKTTGPITTISKDEWDGKGHKNGGRTKFAKGGKTKKSEPHTKVNVIVAGGGHPPMPAMGAPMPPPGGMATPPAKMPMMPPPGAGGPPGAPPPGMMPPPGGGGMPPHPGMPPMNRGGRAHHADGGKINTKIKAPKMEFGAGGGKGRMEKAKAFGAKPLCGGGKM